MIKLLFEKVLQGKSISKDEAMKLSRISDEKLPELMEAAKKIREKFCGVKADICSIINVKSGSCSENCRYCAQSAHYNANVETYDVLDVEKVLERAKQMEAHGAHRFSLVASGRGMKGKDFEKVLDIYKLLKEKTNLKLCASLGILNEEQLIRLREAGVERYHHNLETSKRYFPKICTTHTFEERIETILASHQAGLEICSGGIISMGENMEDRIDMAFTLKELNALSVPVNILNPVTGTPLENQQIISINEILKTIAVLRFILPSALLRYAGGRENAMGDREIEGYTAGINSVIIGSYLTTPGKTVADDLKCLRLMGFEF